MTGVSTLAFLLLVVQSAESEILESIRMLGAEEHTVREKAMETLERAGEAAVPALTAALDDRDPEVRSRSLALLRRLRPAPMDDFFKRVSLRVRNAEDREARLDGILDEATRVAGWVYDDAMCTEGLRALIRAKHERASAMICTSLKVERVAGSLAVVDGDVDVGDLGYSVIIATGSVRVDAGEGALIIAGGDVTVSGYLHESSIYARGHVKGNRLFVVTVFAGGGVSHVKSSNVTLVNVGETLECAKIEQFESAQLRDWMEWRHPRAGD